MAAFPPVARFLVALAAGLATAFGVVAGAEFLAAQRFGGGWEVPGDPAAFARSLRDVPTAPAVLVVLGWGLATYAGARVAASLVPTRRALLAVIVALVLVAVTLLRLVTRPHPFWFSVAAFATVAAAALAARAITRRRTPD